MTNDPKEIELEIAGSPFEPEQDPRPKLEEPLPVRLVAVDDCVLPTAAGIEVALDAFYGGLLGFERQQDAQNLIYRAENFRLRFEVFERVDFREDFRPLGVAVPSLSDLANRLNDAEMEFIRQRGLVPGIESLLLRDPAGNTVEVTQFGVVV